MENQVPVKNKTPTGGSGFYGKLLSSLKYASLIAAHRFWVGTVCDNRFQEPSLTAKMDIKVSERKLINVF